MSNINRHVAKAMAKLVINQEVLETLVKNDAGLNSYRHEATNYDVIWKSVRIQNETKRNTVVHIIQNKVNEQIVKLVQEICKSMSNPVSVKTKSDWIVEYQEFGTSFETAKKLAESKVANAELRAKGAAAKAARKARLQAAA